MSNLSDSNFKVLEKYVLNSFQEDILDELMVGTDIYYTKKCLHILNQRPYNLKGEDKKLIQKFIDNYHTQGSQQIELRKMLIDYDNSKDDQEKEIILKKLRENFLHFDFVEDPPSKFPILNDHNDSNSTYKKIPNEFDIQSFFDIEKEMKDLFKSPNNYKKFNKSLLININFNHCPKQYLMELFEFLSDSILLCNSDSFYQSIINYFEE